MLARVGSPLPHMAPPVPQAKQSPNSMHVPIKFDNTRWFHSMDGNTPYISRRIQEPGCFKAR